jgi:hypothetical protein
MFTRPVDLSDATIVDALRAGWGVRASTCIASLRREPDGLVDDLGPIG